MVFSVDQILILKNAYFNKQNMTEIISGWGYKIDVSMISFLYEMQAGSYSNWFDNNAQEFENFGDEVASVMRKYVTSGMTIVDCGTGEATSLIAILKHLTFRQVLAIDASYSRLTWAIKNASAHSQVIDFAVADMANIPLMSESVDCALPIHAIEPNGGDEVQLLHELGRVVRQFLFLVEPDYLGGSPAQKERMQKLGFITGLDLAIHESEFELLEKIPIFYNSVPENRAALYVLKKPNSKLIELPHLPLFWVDPVHHLELRPFNGNGLTNGIGLWFPMIRNIPFLKISDFQYVLNPFL